MPDSAVATDRPAWLDGLFGEDEPTFFRTSAGRKVHVVVQTRKGAHPLLHYWMAACGVEMLRDSGNGAVFSFPDDQLCARCHKAAGEWSDELFGHPTDVETTDA